MYKTITLLLTISYFFVSITYAAEVNNNSNAAKPTSNVSKEKENVATVNNNQNLEFVNPWARPSMGGGSNSAMYVTIKNNSNKEYKLIGASAMAVANNVELHGTFTDQAGVAQMKVIDKILIPAKTTVELKPLGTHIMLMNLKQNLVAGQQFKLELKFDGAETQEVMVTVREN